MTILKHPGEPYNGCEVPLAISRDIKTTQYTSTHLPVLYHVVLWHDDSACFCFFSGISSEKSFELLIEVWDSELRPQAELAEKEEADLKLITARSEDNMSPAAAGHRFLGLCLVSVQDLMSTPSQTHVLSLQGRPFQDDPVIPVTLTLQVSWPFLALSLSR